MEKPLLDLETMEPPKETPEVKDDGKKPEVKSEENKDDAPKPEEEEEKKPEESTDESKKEEEKKPEDDEEKKPEDKEAVVDIDVYLSDTYKEKYGIENQEQLDETLETLAKTNEELEKKLKDAETAGPKYKSEKQKKIAEFLEQFDPENFGEGVQTAAKLMFMDVDKTDGKLVEMEAYVIDHPELTRKQAEFKFEKLYAKKYAVKDRDQYETEAEFNDAKEEAEIDKTSNEAKARKRLKKEQETLKTAEVKKPEAAKENEEVTKSIERYHGEFEKTFKSFESHDEYHLNIRIDDEDENNFPVKFDKKQIAEIRSAVSGWIKDQNTYNAKGEFKAKLTIPEMIKKASFYLYGEEIAIKIAEHANSVSDIKKAEEIAKKKPERDGSVAGGGDAKNLSTDQQFEILAKKKKAQREGGRVAA